MERWAIVGAQVYAPEPCEGPHALLIEGDRIAAVAPAAELAPALAGVPTLDAGGLLAFPGLIDLQLNGGFGHDFTHDPGSIAVVARGLPPYGVTAFLATIVTAPLDRYAAALEVAGSGEGATVLGVHCEGPFLNPARGGAHDRGHTLSLARVDLEALDALRQARLVTLAPELPLAHRLITSLLEAGVVVSAGHTDATYTQAKVAFACGVTAVTHLFNAMRPYHHREPGIIGATLEDPRVRAGLIVDGVHVHAAAIRLAWRCKGPAGCILVTDAMAAMGQRAGAYPLGDQTVTVNQSEQSARLPDGTLAGSVLTMDAALRNLVAFTGCSPADAARAASTNPAELLGLERKGRLAAGCDADVTLLTPDLRVAGTVVGGRLVYRARSLSPLPPSPARAGEG